MKKILIVCVVLLFIITGCENTYTITCVTDEYVYTSKGSIYNTTSFKKEDLEKLKNIDKFPKKVLFNEGATTFSDVYEVYILK